MASTRDVQPKRGTFIVLEGLDRSGKTTQVKLLEDRLVAEGRHVQAMRFPDRSTIIGQMIDGYLKSNVEMEDHAIHLLFSANRWEAANRIKTLLDQGTTIVSDRYYHSGMVYSAAKGNPSLSLSWAHSPDVGLPRPDVVVFLDLEPEEARRRGGWGDERYEKEEVQRNVRRLFTALADESAKDAEAGGDEPSELVIVNAGGTVEEVSEKIWHLAKERVAQVERGDAGGVRTVR